MIKMLIKIKTLKRLKTPHKRKRTKNWTKQNPHKNLREKFKKYMKVPVFSVFWVWKGVGELEEEFQQHQGPWWSKNWNEREWRFCYTL